MLFLQEHRLDFFSYILRIDITKIINTVSKAIVFEKKEEQLGVRDDFY